MYNQIFIFLVCDNSDESLGVALIRQNPHLPRFSYYRFNSLPSEAVHTLFLSF